MLTPEWERYVKPLLTLTFKVTQLPQTACSPLCAPHLSPSAQSRRLEEPSRQALPSQPGASPQLSPHLQKPTCSCWLLFARTWLQGKDHEESCRQGLSCFCHPHGYAVSACLTLVFITCKANTRRWQMPWRHQLASAKVNNVFYSHS